MPGVPAAEAGRLQSRRPAKCRPTRRRARKAVGWRCGGLALRWAGARTMVCLAWHAGFQVCAHGDAEGPAGEPNVPI